MGTGEEASERAGQAKENHSDVLGEKYAAKAAAAIRADDPKADIRIVRPLGLPNGAKGKDACDWTGDAGALARLAAGALPYEDREPFILEEQLCEYSLASMMVKTPFKLFFDAL